ncbi:protein FRIGIDA-like [Dorcoceras hygrometricum]|uniref:FRIGIDA-like protein n=1 Tax=Dorcoceras hygrometricum TaxID=472368 RepID=A0A2Z7AT68_9LAMI|nr:protein FRIGIDA-like [Dorcoceras hygrometricum]
MDTGMEAGHLRSPAAPYLAEEETECSLPQGQELQSCLVDQSPINIIDSLTELKGLCYAITDFNQCFEDLQNHLESIKNAILSKLSSETNSISTLSLPIEELPNSAEGEDKNPLSELEKLCKTMCSRDVKKYLIANLSNIDKLREEVPRALKLAPNPSKLVLECLGRFFLQGSKAYTKNSPMIPAREASVLILECFLLMMGMDDDDGAMAIDKGVKEEAENVAVAWRKRLLSEGGVAKASEIDARGLLLFLSCFGILNKFKRDDIQDLVVAGNVKEILGVLQKSRALMNLVPEMVEWLIRNNKELSAVDLVYTFGLVERFNPQTILISFLRESKETGKRIKKAAMGSAAAMLQANKKQLATLRSIVECLERYEIDPSKLLPGWQILQKISNLEKEIAILDRKKGDKGNKRKSSETDTPRMLKIQEAKRARFTGHGPQHNTQDHVDALPSHVYNYSATPSVVYGGPGACLIPENMHPPADLSANHAGGLSTGSYSGVYRQVINHGTQPHSWHVDEALIEKYSGHSTSHGVTSLYRASTSAQGFAGNPNGGPGTRSTASDLYQFADSVLESGSYLGSISRGTNTVPVPTLTPAQRSSYLY